MQSSRSHHRSFANRQHNPLPLVLLGIVVSAIGLSPTLPAQANGVVVQGDSVTVQVGDYEPPRGIYSRRDRDDDRYWWGDRGSRGGRRVEIEDSILVNPVVIDSRIEDSVLIDPVIVNTGSGRYRDNRVYSTGGTRPTCQVLSNFRAACN